MVVYSAHFTATLTRGPQISYAQLGSEIAIIQVSLLTLLTQPPWTTASTFAACAIAVTCVAAPDDRGSQESFSACLKIVR